MSKNLLKAIMNSEQSIMTTQLNHSRPICRCLSYELFRPLRQHLIYLFERTPLFSPLLSVEDNGFEPLTPCVQGRCSSQLS